MTAGRHNVDLLEYFGQWVVVGFQSDDGGGTPVAQGQVTLAGAKTRHNIFDPGDPVLIESPEPVVTTKLFHRGVLVSEADGGQLAAPSAPGRYCLQVNFAKTALHVPLTVGHGATDKPGW